jgi:post-segregation antitoxin (ccd killing protein)
MEPSLMSELKTILREESVPYFSDAELEFYARKNGYELNKTVYECLLVKAEDTSLNISGLTTADTSAYYRRLAARYRPNNSGVLQGGF